MRAAPPPAKIGRLAKGFQELQTQNKKGLADMHLLTLIDMAERTGLEPATPGVTGRYSNQLNYHSW